MKINANSMFDGMRQAVETEATKAKEKIQGAVETVAEKSKEIKQDVENFAAQVKPQRPSGKEAKALLDFAGQANRSKMNMLLENNGQPLINFMPKEGTLRSDVLIGMQAGAEAGSMSGKQAARDTHAHGPESLAAFAGGIAGGISGAIDGFNGHGNGASSEDIRNTARANGDYAGAMAGERALFLDHTEGKAFSYSEYKKYQANGGQGSYDEWIAKNSPKSSPYGAQPITSRSTTSAPGGGAGAAPIVPPPPTTPQAPTNPAPSGPSYTGGGTGNETVEDPPPADASSDPAPVVTGDPDKDYTVYVDTSAMESDSDSVDDLI